MAFFEKIRGFFGMPPRYDGHNQPGFKNPVIEEEDGNNDDDYMFYNWESPSTFNIFSGNILEMERFFEQQFDEMMKNFQSTWNWSFPQIEGPKGFLDVETEQSNQFDEDPRRKFVKPEYLEPQPRDRFLRPAYVHPPIDPGSKKDSDIDNKVDPSQILDIFPDKRDDESKNNKLEPFSGKSRIQSHFSSQVIKKRVLPNGGIEEERKCMTDGKEEITVSRQLGDVKHILTTITLPDGAIEKHEQFINLNEDELPNFNKSWGSALHSSVNRPGQRGNSEILIPERHSLFEIFSKFIP